MCSLNPAKILRVNSNGNSNTNSGSIEHNKRADLIITDIANSNQKYQLLIDKVFLKGNAVFSK
jgi:imidazolonepropionase-like amidohydrolase